jgi:hypothetical protein
MLTKKHENVLSSQCLSAISRAAERLWIDSESMATARATADLFGPEINQR